MSTWKRTWQALIVIAAALSGAAHAAECSGTINIKLSPKSGVFELADGSIARYGKMNINIDGSARAYHPKNKAGGALIHLCNGGEVFLPDGTHYFGSESDATCTGKFMDDMAMIAQAGWDDPKVGLIRWFGVLGEGDAEILVRREVKGKFVTKVETIKGVVPRLQPNGFYVSPTALADPAYGVGNQLRYIEPLTVPAGVIPNLNSFAAAGFTVGTAGVVVHRRTRIPVPFIVGDTGPRIGEGTPALARLAAGKPINADMTYDSRFLGQVEDPDLLWVFFGGAGSNDAAVKAPPFGANEVQLWAKEQFDAWGGEARLTACLGQKAIPGL